MATYRAEFLSHYYEGQRRPASAYAFGFVDRWARLASRAPRLANATVRWPGVDWLVRRALDLAPVRELPRFATRTFRQWAAKHGVATIGPAEPAPPGVAVLWVDTFSNHFHPEVLRAAVRVLGHAGFTVVIPRAPLCCGRPLYDFGFLTQAKAYLIGVLDALSVPLAGGAHLVALEPSCASVFRDEIRGLLPEDPRADRLRRQTVLLSELLERHAPGYVPPRLDRPVLLHGHCHQKALMSMSDELSLLRRMGADVTSPEPGCCGMAGPFGLVGASYPVSQAIAERALLPAVREADPETLIVSSGFSCREQIRQGGHRRAIHLAEAMGLALDTRA
jgi:Fe-S oxidoreductase